MKKAILAIVFCTISNIAWSYEGLITLNHSAKRGGKTPTQVINEYKKDNAVVFFSKSGCPYCNILKPRFTTLANKNKNKAQFIVVNVGSSTSYKSSYGFSTYPTVMYYKNNAKKKQHGSNNGSMTTNQMQGYINSVY